jgi:hypothetical protein
VKTGSPSPLMHVSPKDWGLEPGTGCQAEEFPVGVKRSEIEERCRANTYEWLAHQFDPEVGAFYGYYDPVSRQSTPPQTANLIAPWQLFAAFDRYRDEDLLARARRALDWLHHNMVDSHPMSLVLGGIEDNLKTNQLWTKYTADYVISNIAAYQRTGEEEYVARAIQSGKFLLQSQRHEFAPKYDRWQERWLPSGWQSFGRVVNAFLAIWQVTQAKQWVDWAVRWGQYGAALQMANGCFALVHDQYYSSDVAADEIRALIVLAELSDDPSLAEAGARFADWHVSLQRDNGSWWLTVDRYGVPTAEYVGPGDVPNIGMALLLAHRHTGEMRYLVAAVRAMRYCLSRQAVPGCEYPFSDDPNVAWGFWSWDPFYDHTMSPDQSTHHVRGLWFLLDYYATLPGKVKRELAKALAPAQGAR